MAENLLPKLSTARSLNQVFHALAAVQTPAIIWHSRGGERIELSGRVLMNWVDKSANLLLNECEVEEGSTLHIESDVHWRCIALCLAALRAGALLNSNEPQVGVALDAATAARFTRSPDFLLLIDRGPLAMRYTGDSEAVFNVYDGEILDFCALVRSEADQFMGMPPHPTTEVLTGVTNADVLAEILKQARSFDSHQVRLESGEPALAVLLNSQHSFGTPENALAIVCEVLGALVAGYAVLITDPTAGFTAAEIAPILASERAVDTRRQGK
ncbi:TIGR03089 family protein [Rothia aeria]|uniref:TIGR03089 family protein n=1 Tax=Rothia aeria TaxID=172042 RepID=UPI003C7CF2BE